MQNIDFEIGDNIGGLDGTLYFIPIADVVAIPDPNGNIVEDDIELVEDKKFYVAKFVQDTIGFSETKDSNKNGAVYKTKVSGIFAKDTPGLNNILLEMCEGKFIVICKDGNGYYRIVGNIENYLDFETETDSGTGANERNGVKVSFKGEAITSSFFYTGQIETYDNTIVIEDCVSGDPVSILDGQGNVIETVEPGGEFSILLITGNSEVLT